MQVTSRTSTQAGLHGRSIAFTVPLKHTKGEVLNAEAPARSVTASCLHVAVLEKVKPFSEAPQLRLTSFHAHQRLPAGPGVYAIFDEHNAIRYVGVSGDVKQKVISHSDNLGSFFVHAVRVGMIPNATKGDLTSAWTDWLEEAVNEGGAVPPGNVSRSDEKRLWEAPRTRALK
jgi:hypothetical protein